MGYVIEHLGKSLPLCGVYFFIHKWQGRTAANGRLRSPQGTGSPISCGSWQVNLSNTEGRERWDAGGRSWGVLLTPAVVLYEDPSSAGFLLLREYEQSLGAKELRRPGI